MCLYLSSLPHIQPIRTDDHKSGQAEKSEKIHSFLFFFFLIIVYLFSLPISSPILVPILVPIYSSPASGDLTACRPTARLR